MKTTETGIHIQDAIKLLRFTAELPLNHTLKHRETVKTLLIQAEEHCLRARLYLSEVQP